MNYKKSIRKISISALAVILLLSLFIAHARLSGKEQPSIETASVKRGTVTSSVSGNGVLQPLTTVEVKSNVGGQVVELTVDEGDSVKVGQLIARIDPSDSQSSLDQSRADYLSAKAKVDQAAEALSMQKLQSSAGISSAEQALESSKQKLLQAQQEAAVQPKLTSEAINQAESSLESAIASLRQTKSALIPQKMASANAAYEEAKASYEKDAKNLARQKALFEKDFVPKSNVDDAEAQFSVSKAQLESAKSKKETIQEESNQDLKAAEAKVAQARSALATARANRVQDTLKQRDLASSQAALRQAVASLTNARSSAYQNQMKVEDIQQAQAQLQKAKAAVANAQTQLNYTTIVAPRSGVVVKKFVEKGSIVTAGRQAMAGSGSGVTIVDIADVSRMRVVVDVDETDVSKITLGQDVDVTVDAFPDEIFTAKVIKIAPMAEVNQNVTTVPVTVELDDADERLKPEMNATCDFVIGQKDNVLYVPVEAITETDSGPQVTVLNHDKQLTRRIEVGLSGDDYYEVVSGLKENELVVIAEEEPAKTTTQKGPGGPPPM